MGFYNLEKAERDKLVDHIHQQVAEGFSGHEPGLLIQFYSDGDTYIRKTAYLATGRTWLNRSSLRETIIGMLEQLMKETDFKVRQTTVNAAGEIGKYEFGEVQHFFDMGLFDQHHSVRNAVIGSIKKMGEVNPKPVLAWAKLYLHHEDKEIRREICHGIELRGRKFPQDILPLLKELQFDKTARVRNTLIHVLGQIAYKKGCLETVVSALKDWENKELVKKALEEIIDVHHRYRSFAVMTQEQARKYIAEHYTQYHFP